MESIPWDRAWRDGSTPRCQGPHAELGRRFAQWWAARFGFDGCDEIGGFEKESDYYQGELLNCWKERNCGKECQVRFLELRGPFMGEGRIITAAVGRWADNMFLHLAF